MTALALKYSHSAMIDLILQEPSVTTKELGALFGFTAGWVARVVGSDSFQAQLAARKHELIDPLLAATLNERLKTVAIQSMEVLSAKLQGDANPELALEALSLAVAGLK